MIHGGAPAGWLDFSANPNPAGTPSAVRAAVATVSYDRYADLDRAAAEAHLAEDAGVAVDSVLITAGATEAIRLIASVVIARHQAVVVGPTYSEYARMAERAGAAVVAEDARPPFFDPPIERALAHLSRSPGALFVCDPNNPTGRGLGPAGLRELIGSLPPDRTLVVDQSFAPFAPASLDAAECLAAGSVVLVRSLTKVLATPGLRLGYVIASPAWIAALRAEQDPWSVGAHAIAAGAVATWALPAGARACVVGWRERLAAALPPHGLQPFPSEASFLLVHAGPTAAWLVGALAQRRIAVRSCASFGLPAYLRLAVRPPDEQDDLLRALDAITQASAR